MLPTLRERTDAVVKHIRQRIPTQDFQSELLIYIMGRPPEYWNEIRPNMERVPPEEVEAVLGGFVRRVLVVERRESLSLMADTYDIFPVAEREKDIDTFRPLKDWKVVSHTFDPQPGGSVYFTHILE